MVMFLPPNNIGQLCIPQRLYEKGVKGNVKLSKKQQVCYALAPRFDFTCDITVPGQPWHGSGHPKKAYISVKTTLVVCSVGWFGLFFFFLGASCGLDWTEGRNYSSSLVNWGRFLVQSQAYNTLWTNRWGWGSWGQAPTTLLVRRGFPEFGASQEPRATSNDRLFLSCVWTISKDTAAGKHNSKCTLL